MKKFKLLPTILIFALLISVLGPFALADEGIAQPPELKSAAAVITDADTGRVLYDYNGAERRHPASLTKVMTVLLAVEAIERGEASSSDQVTAGEEALDGMVEDGSTLDIKPGETLSLLDLMYCAMLPSANEACNIIAVHISGSISAFVGEMNRRASELGCDDTHFANAHGLPAEDHYTTASDFAVITREAMDHELFLEISGTSSYTVQATELSPERRISNTNGLINPECVPYPGYFYEYARAGKTGHTDGAGYCLASLAERDGVNLICVVLGGVTYDDGGDTRHSNFTDSRSLYGWAFENFSRQEVLGTTETVTSVAVDLAEDGQAMLRAESSISALLPNKGFDSSTLERSVTIYSEQDGEPLTAPIAAGSSLGEVSVLLDDVVLGTSSLVTSGTVELARTEFMKREISGFFGHLSVQVIIAVLVLAVALYVFCVLRYRKLHKRHLRSVEEARLRAAEAEAAPPPAPPEPPAAEPTTVLRSTAPGAAVRRSTAELEKTTVLTGAARRSTGSGPAVREPGPSASAPAQAGAAPQRSSPPPAADKARRDYFEEFFRSKSAPVQKPDEDKKE